jgi:copper chaperone CopZ
MKRIISFVILIGLLSSPLYGCEGKIKNAKTVTFKVYGNCEMCKETIEEAAFKNKEAKVDWDVNSKMAKITFDSTKTNLNAVLKRIAQAGYDSDKFLAPDDVYSKLHGCCQYDRVNKTTIGKTDVVNDHSSHNHDAPTKENPTEIRQETNQLKVIFENYFAVKDALVKSDGKLASSIAKELLTNISVVKMDKLTKEEHTVWMKVMKDLKFDTEHIEETKDVGHQRDHFTTLSKNMYDLIKVSKTETPIYYQNCPMFNDGKGANWLSKENVIKNPYYGSQMLSCGKTVETIK